MKDPVTPELEFDNENTADDSFEEDVYIFPASFGQKRFWFLDQFEPNSPYYNIPSAFRLKGAFDAPVFKKAVQEIFDRHETLRTTFEAIDGEPMQVVQPQFQINIPEIDLQSLEPDDRENELQRLAVKEARTPFNLAKGPLTRVTILKAAENDHTILLTMHHIISDGWSMGVLIAEITALYGAFLEQKPSPLAELPIQYGDFAEWQAEYLQGDVLQKQLTYWEKALGNNPPVLELPSDRPRPLVQTNVGASLTRTIPRHLSQRLNEFSRSAGGTMFMTLMAAFNVVLARYSGQYDISIGTPIAGRTRKETEGLIGLFINTLVMRTQFYDNPSFRELWQRMRQTSLGAFENQDIPFELLVDKLQPDRDMSYPPLFQVMFILQNAPVKAHQVNTELSMEMLTVDMGTSTFDLTLSLSESTEGISVSAEYNTDLFDSSTIERLLSHYIQVLDNAILNPDLRVSEIPLLSSEEEYRILKEWNNTARERDRSLCIHRLFEKQAIETPGATAVVHLDHKETYGELNKQANQIAHYLQKKGAGPEIKVGVMADKSVQLPAIVLGVLKAGSAYLPLDPGYPEDRLKYMLEDAGISILVTFASGASLVTGYTGNIVVLDDEWKEISKEPVTNPESAVSAENLAYMIYTSGSTGKAKGTMVRHSGLVNVYSAWEETYELKTKCRSHLQMASFSFDVFSGDWTRALCSGGKLVLVPRDMLLEAEQLFDYMTREQVTIGEFVPAVLRNLIDYVEQNGKTLRQFRCLIAGSDIWYAGEYKAFKSFTGADTRLINSFGLTEATIDNSWFETNDLNIPSDRLVPIGKPFANMAMYILDEFLQPVPPGVRGELFVGGESLARGYFKRPDLTAERFLPNPFSRTAGERMYRTGDMARYLPDGNVEFLGRADTQVKLRGFRIELGEIESALTEFESIKDAVVILREDDPGDKRLAAYYVPETDADPTSLEMRAFLSEKLPEYMVPSAFVWMESIPLTPNGKVDRRSLPKPDADVLMKEMEAEYIAPRTPEEEGVAAIFSKLLNVEKVGATHNFFLLGGHSLLATQLVSRFKDTFKVEIPLRVVFETPTVAGIAHAVEAASVSTGRVQAPPIVPVNRDQELPLSFAQHRLWFLDRLEPNSPFYNIPENYRIKGPLNPVILQQTVNEIIRRHEILRTGFYTVDGKPLQQIRENLEIEIPLTDLSHLQKEDREKQAAYIIKQRNLEPIPLDRLPLFRFELIRLTPNEHIACLVIHHIISDNWSTHVLMSEIGVIYDSFVRGDVSPLPPLPIQYADFAHWQRNWLSGAVLEQQLAFWKRQLEGSPPVLEMPKDRPRPAVQTFDGSFKTKQLSAELSRRIKALSGEEGATLFMTLLAAFSTLLYRWSGQDDINIGTPIANRNHPEIESLIGFFVNTLVLRVHLDGRPSFRSLIQRTKEIALNAYAHQDLPFEKIVEAVDPERNMSHSPLFQVMFALQSSQASGMVPSGRSDISIEPVEAHSATAKFDLTMFVVEENNRLGAALEYNTDLFDGSTIEKMLAHFERLLTAMTEAPDQPIELLPMISETERQKLLTDWNAKAQTPVFTETIFQLFERQAAEFPSNIAIEFEGSRFSYEETNRLANQLARFLKTKNVAPDVTVGLAVERSPQMIIAILAILKAGGAYVPIDIHYPQDRLQYIMEDSGITLVITTSTAATRLPAHSAEDILLDRDQAEIEKMGDGNLNVTVNEENLAYMIYTSGSTGKPKGTLITHRGLSHYLNWCYAAYPLAEGRGSLVHSTLSFDATVTAVFTPLLTGRTITLIPEDTGLEALGFALLKYKDFNIVKITPAHLELLGSQISPKEASGLSRAFVIGGENLTAPQIEFWQKYAPQTKLFNEYGPTETVVGCVVYEASQWQGRGSVPIGKAIYNTPVYILDDYLQPVPAGVPGELYISGSGVARGYLNRPDLTAASFMPDPYSAIPGSRMYKTGDLVKYLQNGNMEFIRRADEQVKIRGYRIEPGEIESVLLQNPEIDDAVVIVREDVAGDKRLVSYLVPAEDKEINFSDIRQQLKAVLPDYMIPASSVLMDKIPLTANGKVDRRALPKPGREALAAEIEYTAPSTEEEQKLAALWRELLQIDTIGIHDNFFELGGHSLLVTQLVSRIRDAFGIELPLKDIFEAPTIATLLLKIEMGHSAFSAPSLTSGVRPEHIPLSFAQQRLWFLDQLSPGNPFYNIPSAMRIKGALNPEVLESALHQIAMRHESLRTTFKAKDGKPEQIIAAESDFKLRTIDLSDSETSERERKIRLLIDEDTAKPFKLDKGPLFRVHLIKAAPEDHVLLFNIHHIISDGWSTNVLIRELSVLYEAFLRGAGSPLPELKIQYADYAIWQRSWLKDEILSEQLQYWKEAIGVNPPVLNLPLDYPRPAVQTFDGAVHQAPLGSSLSEATAELGRKHGATLFMTLLAAFQAFLHRYSSQDEILTGSPIAGRSHSETEALIGFFVNTIVLKADFSQPLSFSSLLAQTKERTLQAYAHQEIPFEQLVDELQPERSMSHSPLFQVMFVLQNTPGSAQNATANGTGPMAMEALDSNMKTAKFDLTLMIVENADGLWAEFEYNTALFKAETIKAMMEQFIFFLTELTRHPQMDINAFSLLDPNSKQKLLLKWKQPPAALQEPALIQRWFEQRAQQTPDAIAVSYKGSKLTYGELNRTANRLAHFLRKKGIGPEQLTGISLNRSPEMVTALLGVLKAGGVYVPIDPAYPQERIRFILEDSGISLLLTQNKLRDIFKRFPLETIALDRQRQLFENEKPENPPLISHPENAAYMIYTSGSTGKPKGTVIQHRSLCNLTRFQIKDFQLGENSRALQFASFSFDASVSEIFTTLISGATLYLADRNDLMPGSGLVHLLRDNKISVVTLPPSVSGLLKEELFPDLKTLVSAGEACPPDIAAHWAQGRRFINAYGPTENTVCASSFAVDSEISAARVPIGRAIDNVRLYVLDRKGNLLPPGVPGELHIGGMSLARGYFNRPDLTAEKFIPNPFSDTEGERLYRTGDLVRSDENGIIEFLGRVDQQVKIRGFRIEPGEIEQVLKTFKGVQNAIVMVREDIPGSPVLAAYLVLQTGKAMENTDFYSLCAEHLPDYMVPAAFIVLDEIPLTSNGKVDFRSLPKPDFEQLSEEDIFTAPRSEDEQALTDIFCELLNLTEVSVTRSFFTLGGHSLLAAQLASRIRDVFDIEIPLITIFEAPTIAGLTLQIEQLRSVHGGRSLPPLQPVARTESLPLSFAQQRLWFLDQLAPDNATYNIPAALKFTGPFDFSVFKESLAEIIKRHESLRTTFGTENGMPVQNIKETLNPEPVYEDLSHLEPETRNKQAELLAGEDAAEPFDLEIGPLFRTKIIKLDENEHVILFNMHHIISDGWSVSVLIREFSQLYDALSKGYQAQLPALPVQYADFAHWQRSWLKDEILDEQIQFWKDTIGLNPEPLQLHEDYSRPAVQTFNGSSISVSIPAALSSQIKKLSQNEGTTLFMFLSAAFQTLLHRYSGQETILIGSPIAGRNQSEIENLIGFFVNNLVLKGDFSEDPSFRTLLQQTRKNILHSYSHQDLPFEQLVEILQPERDMSRSPIFQVMFVMQNTPMGNMELSDVKIEAVEADQKAAKYDLSLIMMETGETLFAEFEFNTDLFRQETIRQMLNHFEALLNAIVLNPDIPVSNLSIADKETLTQCSEKWNATECPFPDTHTIQQVFEKQAEQTPEKAAVCFNGNCLNYRELNEKANRLAHFLRQKGVVPETIVAISVARSFDMLIGLLGILKAGGVYLPLDPAYPQDRLQYIFKDANVRLLLTQDLFAEQFKLADVQTIVFENMGKALKKQSAENPPNVTDAQNLAYIIYTSGSTGKPKGTMLQHRGLCNLTNALAKQYRVSEESRNLQFASFSFDASVEEIFTALTQGATLYLIERDVLLSGTGLSAMLTENKITNATLPPSLLAVLKPEDFPNLKNVVSAGEACPKEIAEKWAEGRHFVNGYGPTENTVCSTTFTVREPVSGKTVPIGQPIDNVKAYILDAHLQELPAGLPGGLYLSGPGLARGYLNRPDLTAEKFIPNPFSTEAGERLYRSGDLARRLWNGELEFLGREDQQLKIRGFRVEPGEIESVLLRQNGIKNAVVDAVQEKLAAWIIVSEPQNFNMETLRSALSAELPEYMIPSSIQVLDKIPLTPNGKVNYRALPEPSFDEAAAKAEFIIPRTTLEGRLADIWKDILGTKKIGVRDNFFELGGHSLLAMRLLTSIEKQLDKDINLVSFFQDPTIAHMAKMIEDEAEFETGASLIRLRKGDERQALYFVHPSGGAVHHYRELAQTLETDRAVFGIQAQGLDGKMELHKTIEDMASAYIETIREKQPQGPYLLASWSLGSIIVHEMARQLEQMGQKTALLIQLDQTPFITHDTPKDTAEMLANMFKRYFKVDQAYLRTLSEDEQFKVIIKKAKKHKAIPRFIRLADFKRYILVNETQIQAWLQYTAKPYSDTIVLFRSEENRNAAEADLGWKKITAGVDIVDVPGNHITMLQEPHLKQVAMEISKRLNGLV